MSTWLILSLSLSLFLSLSLSLSHFLSLSVSVFVSVFVCVSLSLSHSFNSFNYFAAHERMADFPTTAAVVETEEPFPSPPILFFLGGGFTRTQLVISISRTQSLIYVSLYTPPLLKGGTLDFF